MARKQFSISYPDGSKKHVSAAEREQMLLAGELKRIDETRYKWVGEVKTFHTFADLQALRDRLETSTTLRRFLPGHFVFEHQERQHFELLETPEAMGLRLSTPSGPRCKFNADYALQESKRAAA